MPLIEITQEAADALESSKFDNASEAILAAIPKKKQKFNPTDCVPTAVNFAAWSDWVFFRKEKRKPISKRAASMQLKMLAEYDYTTQQQIIDSSIQNDYQGLFAPKGGSNGQNRYTNSSHAQRSASDSEQLLAIASALEDGHGAMGANEPALPQPVDSGRGLCNTGWQAEPEFQLVAEEDGTVIDRRFYDGDAAL